MISAGETAMGFICANLSGTGAHFPLIQEVLQYVYARGKGPGPERDVGTGPWIKGMLRGLLTTEGIRTAMRHFGDQPLTGAQVQWGLEHLSLTPASLKELGAEGLLPPLPSRAAIMKEAEACSSSSGTARSGPCSPIGSRRIGCWCDGW